MGNKQRNKELNDFAYEEKILHVLKHLINKKEKGDQFTIQEKTLWDGLRDYGIR